MKRLFLLLALCSMVAVGCTEGGGNEIQDDAYITLNKEVLTFVPDGESVEVKVCSNYEWTLTNNCDWVTASISGGEASVEGTTITLTADLTYDDREGTITFSCGKAKKVLVVLQGLKEVIIADENNTFNLPVEGGTVDIAYQTTVECEVVIPSDAQHWISLAPETRGLESGCATLNIAKSKAGADRRAVVKVVKMGDQSVFAEYTITQERNMDYIIFYTTTNGETIRPNKFDYLTNTYEDGIGMLAFDGSKVTSIGHSAFLGCSSLTSVTIPDSVTSIGDAAFSCCTSLTSVTIPDSVTSIGDEAFRECTSLTSVTIPDSVTSIGELAFIDCTSLTSVTIPDSVTSIGDAAFSWCTSLTSVTIPDSVTSIGELAFSHCTSLTSVTIPDSVTSIGSGAFYGCTSLTSITIPDSVTSIGDEAFRGCTSLTSITIPNSVTSIGDYAFHYCTSLTSVTIGNGITSIGSYAFCDCDSLKEVYCKPTTPPTGGNGMFDENASGRKIYVPAESVEAYKVASGWSKYASKIIGYNFKPTKGEIWYTNGSTTEATTPYQTNVFGANIVSNTYDAERGCWTIKFDDYVPTIGDKAFYECSSLTSVTIDNGVTSIGDEAFRECTSLTSVTIGNDVTMIGDYAFGGCTSLTSVTIGKGVTSIGDWAFSDCKSLTSVYITDIAAWCNISFNTSDSNPLYYEGNLYLNNELVTDLIIPDSVTSIGDDAFSSCNSLTSVTIPDSVTSIGDDAFYSCKSLTSVTIGKGVTSIGDDAFLYCDSLTSVTIPDSVTSIGDDAFYSCDSLTSVTIGNGVTKIGSCAFSRCDSLKEVYCKPTTPPAGRSDMFYGNASSRKIYVPTESVNAYKSASYWSDYKDYIVGYDF